MGKLWFEVYVYIKCVGFSFLSNDVTCRVGVYKIFTGLRRQRKFEFMYTCVKLFWDIIKLVRWNMNLTSEK